ncbi:MAG: hypothetical protein IPL06_09040 [Betaproteobacteria bacterium]|nr:hypothetical protein [Betaproteobacteria bacterium]
MNVDRHRRMRTLVFGFLATALGVATAAGTVLLALRLRETGGDLLAHPRFVLTAWIFPAYAVTLLAIGWSLLRHGRLARGHLVVVGGVIVATALAVLLAGDVFRAAIHLALGGVVVWQLRGFLPRRE